MFSSATENALTNFSSWVSSNSENTLSKGQRAAAKAIQDFCKKSGIRRPSGFRTIRDVGADLGREIKYHAAKGNAQGLTAALKLLNFVGELEYQILVNLVAEPLSPSSMAHDDPKIFGEQIIQVQRVAEEEFVYDLRSGKSLGPPIEHRPRPVGNLVQYKGSVIGMFQTSCDDRTLSFFDLTKNYEIFSVPEAESNPDLLECRNGVYAFTERYTDNGRMFTVYNVTEKKRISEVVVGRGEQVRVQRPQLILGELYQAITTVNSCIICNHFTRESFTVRDLSNPSYCEFFESQGSVYALVRTDAGSSIFNVSGQKLAHSSDRNATPYCIGWKDFVFQVFELTDHRENYVAYDAIGGKQLKLRDGTPIRSLDKVGEELYASAFSDGIWRIYNWQTGQQVGIESEGPIDVVECDGKAYQLGSNEGLDFTYCLDRGALCLELTEHADSYLPVGTNGRAFRSAEIGDAVHHYDLETGSRVLYGASKLVVADGKAVFMDKKTAQWFVIPIEAIR